METKPTEEQIREELYKNYTKENEFSSNPKWLNPIQLENGFNGADLYTKEEFINKIKTDDEFAKKWGDLGLTKQNDGN